MLNCRLLSWLFLIYYTLEALWKQAAASKPLAGLNKYLPVVIECVVFVQIGYSKMKTLFTSLTGVIYCVISIKHGLAHLYGKGQGDMCGLCNKFAEENDSWSQLVYVKFPAGTHRDQLGPSGPSWEFNQIPAGVSYHFLLGMQCSMWFKVGSWHNPSHFKMRVQSRVILAQLGNKFWDQNIPCHLTSMGITFVSGNLVPDFV